MYHPIRILLLGKGFLVWAAFCTVSAQQPKFDCSKPPPEPRPLDPNANYGYIHDIIGRDGAFLISLMRKPDRFEYSAAKLAEAGIIANQFPAADGYCEAQSDVERGCFLQGSDALNEQLQDVCTAKQGWGWGCDSMGTAACAESHHRALEIAQHRQHNWTLIMEDDAIPLNPATWQENFKQVWQKIPTDTKLVRFGWCTFPTAAEIQLQPVDPCHIPEVEDVAGEFKIIRHIYTSWFPYQYDAGLCTTGYMIHRDAIPDMLGIFPCCCGMDCCMGQALLNPPKDKEGQPYLKGEMPWGYKHMVSLDVNNSADMTLGWNKHKRMYQYGILAQDNREISTVRLTQESADSYQSDADETALKLDAMTSELNALMYMLH